MDKKEAKGGAGAADGGKEAEGAPVREMTIRVPAGRGAKDAAAKILVSQKPILARVLVMGVPEFEGRDPDWVAEKCLVGEPKVSEARMSPDDAVDAIRSMDKEDATLSEGSVFYDVVTKVLDPEYVEALEKGEAGVAGGAAASPWRVEIIIDVEPQGDANPGYPLEMRAQVYACRLVSQQYEGGYEHCRYDRVRRVYSIFVVFNPAAAMRNMVVRYAVRPELVEGSGPVAPKEWHRLMSFVMVYLGDPDEEGISKGMRMLDILFTHMSAGAKLEQLRREFGVVLGKEAKEAMAEMDGWSEGYWQQGYDKRAEEDRQTIESLRNEARQTIESLRNEARVEREEKEEAAKRIRELEALLRNAGIPFNPGPSLS